MDHSSTGARPAETMNNAYLFRFALWLLGIALGGAVAMAQQPAATPPRITMHVTDLTSADRDALARDLAISGGSRIAFACVPAGILVLEGHSGLDRSQLEQLGRRMLNDRSLTIQRAEQQGTIAQAEEACAQARSR